MIRPASGVWTARGSGLSFLQRQMGPGPMIITAESVKVAVQAGLVEYDQVIKAFATDAANDPFDIRALPRTPRGRKHLFDAHRLHLLNEVVSENAVTISQQKTGRAVPWKCLPELLC